MGEGGVYLNKATSDCEDDKMGVGPGRFISTGAWVAEDQAYGKYCGECGCEDVYYENWIENRNSDTMQVSGMKPPGNRLRCVMCGVVNCTTISKTQAAMLRWFLVEKQAWVRI